MSNLPSNQRDVEENKPIYTTVKGHKLTHYVLAERMIQWEYRCIMNDVKGDPTSEALIYILEGGFRGFHKYSKEHLREEWLDGAEDKWYQLYADAELPWEPYEEDPINKKLTGDPKEAKQR